MQDLDDQPEVIAFDVGLQAAPAERTLQGGGVARDLLLHPFPRRLVVLDVGERLLGAARQGEGRVDGPAAGQIRHWITLQADSKRRVPPPAVESFPGTKPPVGDRCLPNPPCAYAQCAMVSEGLTPG